MKLLSLLENYGPMVVTDVQPAYERFIGFDIPELMRFCNDWPGRVIFMINAEGEGLTSDRSDECLEWWEEWGLETHVHVIDKGYGFLRGWMDSGVDSRVISDVIDLMYRTDVHDSRDLDPEVIPDDAREEVIYLPYWTKGLKRMLGSSVTLCGGSETECLAEVDILLNGLGIATHTENRFVYS